MKDIPPFLWILFIFVFGAIGIFFYSQTGSDPIPEAQTVWSEIENFRQTIQYRREALAVGEKKDLSTENYSILVTRLPDLTEPNTVARYTIQTQVKKLIPLEKPWIEGGLDLGLIDDEPKETVGRVRFVSSRKEKDMEQK